MLPQPILPKDPMVDIPSLTAMLARRAELTPDRTAVVFGDAAHTYASLWEAVRHFAGYLQDRGVMAGDRVLLRLPNSADFFAAYYGVQYLGAVAVPVFHGSSAARVALLAKLCGARMVVTAKNIAGPERDAVLSDSGLPDLVFGDCEQGRAFEGAAEPAAVTSEDLAMLQYTSGTTGDSKGVMLTHGNLIANVRQMIPAAEFVAEDVFVSWLPVYHDMGLITMTMCPFYLGAKLVLLPVSPKPFPWFKAIKEHGGTMTAAPDFGYRFATKFSKGGGAYDLSSLKRALIAAEPVRPKTIERFESKFDLPGVLKPGYGLAEASVAVTFWDMQRGDRVVDGEGHVSAGKAIPGMEAAVVVDERFAATGEHGEIVMRSPSCTQGYYRNPTATEALHWRDGWIRTGDIGYLDENGLLFIVGRSKHIIIKAGRNLAPREIEEIAEDVPGIRLSAALGISGEDIQGEQIHLFIEIEKRSPDAALLTALSQRVTQAVFDVLGYRPDKVHLGKNKLIPRTHNGKIQYGKLKQAWLDGSLHRDGLLHVVE
ncbi:class I adenylate-forming enzyme family protein [Acanthopleuribacter pedis]|uniref:AMP-binding protein n=1 Tax=Acanthopleuribacter pedis TaxID=442870 RepID=A0A8J7QD64_9BACT|nr:AMP-binding protein [Acanthopleuribacter pedis]MBO1322362.1 AMP-binding protein [Acanthopleuribacter pedis]